MFFFDKYPGVQLDAFGAAHLIAIACVALVYIATVLAAKKIKSRKKLKTAMPFVFLGVALAAEIINKVWMFRVWPENFIYDLVPLELCSLCFVLSIPLTITKSRALFDVYYFFSFGAPMAVLFPDYGGYGPDRFRFYHFFFTHAFIFWLTIWFLAVEGYRLTARSFARMTAVMFPLAFFVLAVDETYGAGYMFLRGPGQTASPLNFLGTGKLYFVNLMGLALAIFSAMYLLAPKKGK